MKNLIIFVILFTIVGITTALSLNASAQQISSVPNWIKSISSWWSEGKISDQEYLNATQFLVNSGIIKIPLIVDLQNQITSLKSQLNYANLEIASLKNHSAASHYNSSSSASSASNSLQSAPNSLGNSPSLDPKKLSRDWYRGTITDQQFVDQIQSLINSGQIPPYTIPSREVLTTKPTPQTNVPEQIPSQGYITQIDKNDLLRKANSGMINTGYLRYWFADMCGAGSIIGDCTVVFPELGSHTMYPPGNFANNIPTDNATAAREKEIVIQWATNNMTGQDFINQILPFFYNGTTVYPEQDFKQIQTPAQPIPPWVKGEAAYWADGSISDDQWRITVLGTLYRLGYLHNP